MAGGDGLGVASRGRDRRRPRRRRTSRRAPRPRRSASRVLPTPPAPVRVTSARPAQQPAHLGQLPLPPDEAGQQCRQVGCSLDAPQGGCRGPECIAPAQKERSEGERGHRRRSPTAARRGRLCAGTVGGWPPEEHALSRGRPWGLAARGAQGSGRSPDACPDAPRRASAGRWRRQRHPLGKTAPWPLPALPLGAPRAPGPRRRDQRHTARGPRGFISPWSPRQACSSRGCPSAGTVPATKRTPRGRLPARPNWAPRRRLPVVGLRPHVGVQPLQRVRPRRRRRRSL